MADEDLSSVHVNGLVVRQLFELSRPQHTVEQAVGRDADRCLEHCDHVCAFFHTHFAIVDGDFDQRPVLTFVRMVMLVPRMLRRFHLLDFHFDEFDAAIRKWNLSLNLDFADDEAGVRRRSVDLDAQDRGEPPGFVAIPFSTCRFHGSPQRSC
ncbi:hypothetical protein WT61_01940 [Burkholderia stagnalis]|nr:hypothetical protein WT61_01940 [Burkholderia stagnalis]KWH42565.1 hypothetical protein WT62_18605 [Burkholderia stagnalis]